MPNSREGEPLIEGGLVCEDSRAHLPSALVEKPHIDTSPPRPQVKTRCRLPALVAAVSLATVACAAVLMSSQRNPNQRGLLQGHAQESVVLDSVEPTSAALPAVPSEAPLTEKEIDENDKTHKHCACVRPKFAKQCAGAYSAEWTIAEDHQLRCLEDPYGNKPWCYVSSDACPLSQASQVKSTCRWRYASDNECSVPVGPLSNIEVGSYRRQIATCVLDVHQLTMALAYAGLDIYYAIQPGQSQQALAINVMAILSSLTWATSFLAAISSSCKMGIDNRKAFCASNIAWFFGNVYQIAIDGMAIDQHCVKDKAPTLPQINASNALSTLQSLVPKDAMKRLPKRPLDAVRRKATEERRANRTRGRGLMGIVARSFRQRKESKDSKNIFENLRGTVDEIQERQAEVAACVLDVQTALSYLARVGLLLSELPASSCTDPDKSEPEKKECAVDIINIFSWTAWVAEYFALVSGSCPVKGSEDSHCAAPILDLIASSTSLVVAGDGMVEECPRAEYEKPNYTKSTPV